MAENKQVIIDFKIEASEALQATVALTDKLNQLKETKKQLEQQLKQDSGNKQLKEQLVSVNAQIGATASSLRGYQKELTNVVKAGEAENKSLEQQRAVLANLTRQWDRLSAAEREGAKGTEIVNQIKATTDNLIQLEGSTGRFQRNVGNYKSALNGAATALQGVGGAAGSAITGIKALGASLKALVVNPWAALIAAIAAAFMQLKKAIQDNDEASTAWAELMATMKPILNVIKGLFVDLANVLTNVFRKVADWNQQLLKHFPILAKWAEHNRQVVKAADELEDTERRVSAAIAEYEANAARAMEIATDSENESFASRKQALNDWWEAQLAIYNSNMELEKARLKQLIITTAAEHNIVQDQGELWNDYLDRVEQGIVFFSDSQKNAIISQSNAVKAVEKGLAEAERTFNKTQRRILNDQKAANQQRKKNQQEVEDTIFNLTADEHQKLIKEVDKYYDELVAKASGNKKQIEEIERLRAIAIAKVYTDEISKGLDGFEAGLQQVLSKATKSLQDFRKQSDLWDQVAKLAEENEYATQMREAESNAERLAIAAQFAQSRLEIAQMMYDSMSQMEGESDAEFALRQQQQLKQLEEYKAQYNSITTAIAADTQQTMKTQLDMVNAFSNATTSMTDALIDALSKATGDEEKYQKWKIIMSIIDAQVQGALAIMSAITTATPGDPYSVAARIAAAAGAAGAATITAVAQLIALKSQTPAAPKFAEGGLVTGPGTGTSDSITARLSNGESVMTARATQQFAPLLSAMNVAGGGAPITQTGQNNTLQDMFESAFANMPAPVVSVKEINNTTNRVRLKESISKNN